MKKLGGFLWFALAVGAAAIITVPLYKWAVGGLFGKVGAKGAQNYVDAA
jgi:hypothetical protein